MKTCKSKQPCSCLAFPRFSVLHTCPLYHIHQSELAIEQTLGGPLSNCCWLKNSLPCRRWTRSAQYSHEAFMDSSSTRSTTLTKVSLVFFCSYLPPAHSEEIIFLLSSLVGHPPLRYDSLYVIRDTEFHSSTAMVATYLYFVL